MYPPSLARLMDEFGKIPGVGRKSASRMAFYIMGLSKSEAGLLADAILSAKNTIHLCSKCQNFTDDECCIICSNQRRDTSIICVVESPRDIIAMEKTREFNGVYHVLHGCISPIDGIGPDNLKIRELLERLAASDIHEVIMATNPNVEGEATAMYLAKLIHPFNIKVTRLAHGIPVGGDLEYADEITLARALEGRREI
jgi:recombination protein RecR